MSDLALDTADFKLETRLASGKVLTSQTIAFHRGQITAKAGAQEGFKIADWKNLQPLFFTWRASAIVQGSYSYDNGFGHRITESICSQIVPNYYPSQTPTMQGAQWVDCKQVPTALRQYQKALKEAAKKQQPTK